jgi:hypothetical protein
VEQDDKNSTSEEYPTPAPSSRLASRKLSIPPRPAHEDSTDSLLERALVSEPHAQSSLREGSTASETSEEVHPTFQQTFNSINTLLESDTLEQPTTITSSAVPVGSSSSTTYSSAATTSTPTHQSTYTSSSTHTTPTHTTPSKPHQLDGVEHTLAALEERARESVQRAPEGPAPSIAPVTDSSRSIRTALEVYQSDATCAQCHQSIQGRHLLALDKHWRILPPLRFPFLIFLKNKYLFIYFT